jgi:phosphatidate cytidylyltransferase
MKRVLTALLAGSLAVAAVLLLDSPLVFWVVLALQIGCAAEYNSLGRRLHPVLPRPLLLLAVPWVAVSWLLPATATPAALPFILLAAAPLLFAVVLMPNAPPAAAVGALGWASFGLPYLVLPVWSIYELHRLDPALLLVFLVAVWGNDSVAFLVGSRWGRRKLAPKLSPNKSWEGSIGGLVGSGLIAAAGFWLMDAQPRWPLLAILMVAMVAAQIGDLVESMLKRAAQVKDSGRMVPGHGGLLDRLDAIILAAPVFYGLLGVTGLAAGLPE